jgi:hypothetical protein
LLAAVPNEELNGKRANAGMLSYLIVVSRQQKIRVQTRSNLNKLLERFIDFPNHWANVYICNIFDTFFLTISQF